MKAIARMKEALRNEKELLARNREAVTDANRRSIRILFSVALSCYCLCFVLSLFVKVYAPLRIAYICGIAVLITGIGVFRHGRQRNPVAFSTVFCGLIVILAGVSGAFITPEYIGVIILMCLFLYPVFVLTRKSAVFLAECLFAAVYLCFAVPHKSPFIVTDEIVNVAVFLITGCATGAFFQNVRLQNLDMIRQENIERITDGTTGLTNRRGLFEYFIEREAGRTPAPYALVMLDIDWFKIYNDTYGHLAGDECLRKLGAYFNCFGAENGAVFYRYGGEEFVAVIQNEPPNGAAAYLEALVAGVRALRIPSEKSAFSFVTVSAGLAPVPKGAPDINLETVVDRADKAMYTAKMRGRNQAVQAAQ